MSEQTTAIFLALWAISEALTYSKKVEANGVFQLIRNILKTVTGK